jgi:hypothetical protein
MIEICFRRHLHLNKYLMRSSAPKDWGYCHYYYQYFVIYRSRNSSVRLTMAYGLETEELEFDSRQKQNIFLFSTASRRALWSIQPPVQWVLGFSSCEWSGWGMKLNTTPCNTEGQEYVNLHLHSPICLHSIVFN